jgi:hypothetical protein
MRKIVGERIKEMDLTLAEVSRAIGKNPSYMHQFINRGSPPYPSEGDRPILANMLGIAEHLMIDPGAASRAATRLAYQGVAGSRPNPASAVPAYQQSDEISSKIASEHLPRCITSAHDLIAIRIQTGHGRLEPGDVAYLGRQPARLGDTVFVLQDQRLSCWGRLTVASQDAVTIEAVDGLRHIARAQSEILRLMAIFTV